MLPPPARASAGDSTAFRLELGQRTDVTNEQYVDYAELFVDSAFVGAERRLASTPERRYGGFVAAGLAGTRDAGATRYRLDSEVLAGERLSTARLAGSWRRETPSGWEWRLDPDAGYRLDRTFERDREEWRAALGGRLRRESPDGAWAGEARARGDLLRVSGSATDLLADRQALALGGALERLGLLGEWRLGYGLAMRAFPDSATRDHLEHEVEAGGRAVLPGGHALAFDARVARRSARAPGPLSRDDFVREEAGVELGWLAAPTWGGAIGCEAEAIQYDRPDSSVYADAQRLRGNVRLHLEPGRGTTLRLEAHVELAWSAAAPEEEYLECAAGPGFEWFGGGAWWDVAPRAGRRWPAHADRGALAGVPGGFDFYEVQVGADQPLGAGLRLRIAAGGRIEEHDDPSLDARSLYVSVEFRWRALGGR